MSTLPIAVISAGAALTMIPASLFMRRFGKRRFYLEKSQIPDFNILLEKRVIESRSIANPAMNFLPAVVLFLYITNIHRRTPPL